jgi:hypothetical protein
MSDAAQAVRAATAGSLAALDAESLGDLIRASLGPEADSGLWDALTDPTVISRTKAILDALDADLLSQVQQANSDLDEARARCLALGYAGRQEFADAKAGQADWRRRTAGFRRLVLRRKAFVKERAAILAAEYATVSQSQEMPLP